MNARIRVCAISLGAAILLHGSSAWADALGNYRSAVTNEPSLISYYTFDQSNALDSRGLHNGTALGGVTFGPGIGGNDKALHLDGTGRVNLGTVADFHFSDGTGSIEAWVRVEWSVSSIYYNPCLFCDRNGDPVTWSVHMEGNKSAVGLWNGYYYGPLLSIPGPGTNWHHLVVVFNQGNLSMYWDGATIGTISQGLGPSPSSTQIGSSSGSSTAEGWIGMFDEVAFYRDALSAAAVQAHYLAFVAGGHTLETALNTTNLMFTAGGTAPWIPQTSVSHDGIAAVRSGAIADSRESWLQTTVNGPGTVAFWWKVSSEGDADLLQFYVGATVLSTISGGVNWQRMAVRVPAGSQTIRWRYSKDSGAISVWMRPFWTRSFSCPIQARPSF